MLTILFCFILSLFILGALGMALLYVYESQLRPESRLPAPRPLALAFALTFWGALSGGLLCLCLRPFGKACSRSATDKDNTPLVLVHGLYHSASTWVFLAAFLTRQGRAVSTFSYPTFGATPESINKSFDAFMSRFAEKSGGKKPILVGHSLGGLVIRNWLRNPANTAKAAGLIALGTPHQGSTCACLAPGALAAALRPDAPFISEMKNAAPIALPCIALASPTDGAVLPASSLIAPEGWDFYPTKALGHFTLLFAPSVARQLVKAINSIDGQDDGNG